MTESTPDDLAGGAPMLALPLAARRAYGRKKEPEEETVPIALNGYFRMIREKRGFPDNYDALACENGRFAV